MGVLVLVLAFAVHLIVQIASSSSPSVIIIGAGVSGISAAKTLHDAGIRDILILEATNHIGGRVDKTMFGGVVVESGANWVEGVGGHKANPIWDFAKKFKLNISYSDYSNISANTYKQEGGLYPKHLVEATLEKDEKISSLSTNFSKYLSSRDGQDISIFTSERMFDYYPSTPLEMVINYYNHDYEDSEPPRITSLMNNEPIKTFINFGDNQYLVVDARGYERIVHEISKQFLSSKHGVVSDKKLQMNKVVRKITYSKNRVTVKTEDNFEYHASFALISVSLGVLQTKLIKFKPNLPKEKTLAINGLNMAVFTKIFVKFPHTFWPTGPGTQFFLYAHERRGYYPIWQHFEKEYPGSNMLMVIVTDEEAIRIEKQSNANAQAEIMDVLRKMFGSNIPKPVDILIPRWWSNRFFKGSFMNWPIGFTPQNFEQLRAPVGPLFFTGEHTSRDYFGYVHGAYLAGVDSANQLINKIRKGS